MESDLEFISDEEEYTPSLSKNSKKQHETQKNEPKNNKYFANTYNHGKNIYSNPFSTNRRFSGNYVHSSKHNSRAQQQTRHGSTTAKPESYEVLRPRILSCFNDGVIIPIMNVPLIYSEKYTTMFDYKNGGCRKGVFHGHKTVQKYFACCTDTFTILDFKSAYIKRRDKEIAEKIKRRIEQHVTQVSRTSNDKKMHIEMLILAMFASKTTVTIEDLEHLFFDVYKIRLNPLFDSDRPLLKSIQLMNSPNMRVSITQKSSNIICIPPTHLEFHSYKDKIENYMRVLEIEDKISRKEHLKPTIDKKKTSLLPKIKAPLTEILMNQHTNNSNIDQNDILPVSNESPGLGYDKASNRTATLQSRVESLLSLADLNVPKIVQKDDLDLPLPFELYKEVDNHVFFHCIQSLKLDKNEDQPFINTTPAKKNDINKE